MIRVVPYRIDHLLILQKLHGLFSGIDLAKTGPALMENGSGMTALSDGSVVACGGVIPRHRGCGEVWIAVTEELKRRPLVLIRIVRHTIESLQLAGFHRLEIHVPSEQTEIAKWAEALGFIFEARLRQYGPDRKDHNLYSLVTCH